MAKIKDYIDIRDVLVFGGIGLVAYGSWSIYHPAGFLSAGAILLYLGLLGAHGRNK